LHRRRDTREDLSSIGERLRGLKFSFGMDHLRPPVAFGLCLFGNRPHHVVGELYSSDLHICHLDAPGFGLAVENGLHIHIQLDALGKHLVEFVLTQHRSQRRLRQHFCRRQKILHLNNRTLRIRDLEIQDRVHFHGDVVVRDHILARYLNHLNTQIHPHHLLDEGKQQHQAWALDLIEPAKREDHCTFVFT
jgi:hypothetical protein